MQATRGKSGSARGSGKSGTPRKRRRLAPEARRAQLLDEAITAFARRGLARAGHAEIAEACEVSVATVFAYFPSREALVDAVLSELEREAEEIAERCYPLDAGVPEAIHHHVRAILDLSEQKPAYGLIWLDWSTAVRDERIWPRYLEFQDRQVARIAEAIVRGQRAGRIPTREAPEICARLIVGSAQMLAQMLFTKEPRERIEAFADAVIDLAVALDSDRDSTGA